ncbi:hypothetical protein [Longimicrobium terrae]|uniref:Uncharacterized protein n=1 Tax=Longimicrobium terrae TaxID=1639882 RepID=A0A841GTL5_9BACT|nr:hypothetical protein [Longimicrobium terrae]MBB4634642.1 hypothetical protein [Longimicrobium terrae]MBB6068468.1 hypothetical protein [Longimicrobium terrae]NNC27661.1 hypothetical protein [Longimicrobium terrae]
MLNLNFRCTAFALVAAALMISAATAQAAVPNRDVVTAATTKCRIVFWASIVGGLTWDEAKQVEDQCECDATDWCGNGAGGDWLRAAPTRAEATTPKRFVPERRRN